MNNELGAVIDALRTLGITADSLFAGIREDLERGLVREARARLDWVDVLVRTEDNAAHDGRRSRTVQPLVGTLDRKESHES